MTSGGKEIAHQDGANPPLRYARHGHKLMGFKSSVQRLLLSDGLVIIPVPRDGSHYSEGISPNGQPVI
jgi:hypothetical protein